MAEDLGMVRRSGRAQEVEPATDRCMPDELPVASASARMARRPFATADSRARARLAPERNRSDLRTDPSRAADRAARQYRPEGRRRAALPGRARHQVLSVARLR